MRFTSKSNGLFSSLTLATILATGLMVAAGLVSAAASYFYFNVFQRQGSYQNLSFTVEGKPLLVTGYYDPLRPSEYRTLTGALIEDQKSIDLHDDGRRTIPPENYDLDLAGELIWRVSAFQSLLPGPGYWYLVHDGRSSGKAYFVGYNPLSKQLIGYLGRGGFSTKLPTDDDRFKLSVVAGGGGTTPGPRSYGSEPTSYDPDWPQLYLMDDGHLRKVDLARQSISTVEVQEEVVAVGNYDHLTAVADDRRTTSEPRLVVRTANALQIMNTAGEPIRSIELTEPMRDKMIQVRGTTVDQIILETSTPHDHYVPHDVYWIAADGKVLRHEVVDIWKRPGPDGSAPYWVISALMPVPLLLMGVSLIDANSHRYARMQIDFTQRLTEIISNGWLPFLLVTLACLALAVYTYRRQRRYDASTAWAWATFVFLLGPLGLAGYFLSRQWPPVVSCEVCGKPVPRDRPTCRHCSEAFPPAKPKEIEVFA